MVERTVQILNKNGLHARPAAEIVKLAAKYRSEITISRDGTEVNGKSIMGVMMLAAAKGTVIVVEADGDDEDKAITALVQLIESGFGEEIAGRADKGGR
jgi:phosphocarrier protein HPr